MKYKFSGETTSIDLLNLLLTDGENIKVEAIANGEDNTRTFRRWTDAERKEMKQLYKQNWTEEDLAKRYHRTVKAVKIQLGKLGMYK